MRLQSPHHSIERRNRAAQSSRASTSKRHASWHPGSLPCIALPPQAEQHAVQGPQVERRSLRESALQMPPPKLISVPIGNKNTVALRIAALTDRPGRVILLFRRSPERGLRNRQAHGEGRALTDFACDRHVTAHHLTKASCNRQAEPGAAVLARGQGIALLKFPEQPPHLVGVHSDAGIGYRKLDTVLLFMRGADDLLDEDLR